MSLNGLFELEVHGGGLFDVNASPSSFTVFLASYPL